MTDYVPLTQQRKAELIEATLKWCNDVRATKGKKPLKKLPKGNKKDPQSCPCGKATGLTVFTTFALANNSPNNDHHIIDNHHIYLPPLVTQFTVQFDRGNIPELIEGL